MTLNEFRAWFDGFSEAIGDAPTPEQWAKIKAKVGEVREPVVVPSTWPGLSPLDHGRPWWESPVTSSPCDPGPGWRYTPGSPSIGRPVTTCVSNTYAGPVSRLGAEFEAAIFDNIEQLYEN